MKRLLLIFTLILLFVSLQAQVMRVMPFYKAPASSSPYGPELCPDPGFDNPSEWFGANGITISGGTAHVTMGTAAWFIGNTTVYATGKTYRVEYTISGFTNGNFIYTIVGGVAGIHRTENGTYVKELTAGQNDTFYIAGSGDMTFTIDNASVKEKL